MAEVVGLGERPEVMFLSLQEELRERLHANEPDDEYASEDKPRSTQGNVEDAAQPLPALALGIVEDLFVHREMQG